MGVAIDSYRNLAIHNREMNRRLYAVVIGMDPAAVHAESGGFFGSIFGGLNHILFGDHFILTRIKRVYSSSSSLDAIADQWDFEPTRRYADDLPAFERERSRVDDALVTFAQELTESDLGKETKLPNGSVPLWALLDHLFQHQTHHRGQITTLLTQLRVSYGSVENPIEVYLSGQGL